MDAGTLAVAKVPARLDEEAIKTCLGLMTNGSEGITDLAARTSREG